MNRKKIKNIIVVIGLMILGSVALVFSLMGHHDFDTWYHLRIAASIFENKSLPSQESIALLGQSTDLIYPSWIFQVIIFGIYKLFGLYGLIWFRAFFVLLTLFFLYTLILKRSDGRHWIALPLALIAMVLIINRNALVRPHLFCFLFLTIELYILETFFSGSAKKGILLFIPLIQILWVNTHGASYFLSPFILGVYIFQALIPHLRKNISDIFKIKEITLPLFIFLTSFLAILTNPSIYIVSIFYHFSPFLIYMMDKEFGVYVSEMQPIPFQSLLSLGFWGAPLEIRFLFLGGVLFFIFKGKKQELKDLIIFTTFLFFLLRHKRFIAEFAIVAAPIMAANISYLIKKKPQFCRGIFSLLCSFFILELALVVGSLKAQYERGHFSTVYEPMYPVGAVNLIKGHGLKGSMFNEFSYGGYLQWYLYPNVKIFGDMRNPVPFDSEDFWLNRNADDSQVWKKLKEKYDFDMVLVPIWKSSTLGKRLMKDSAYKLVYFDPLSLLFLNADKFKEVVQKFGIQSLDPLDSTLSFVIKAKKTALGEIESEAQRLLSLWPKNKQANLILCLAYVKLKKMKEAEELAQVIERLYPDEIYPYYWLGQASINENPPIPPFVKGGQGGIIKGGKGGFSEGKNLEKARQYLERAYNKKKDFALVLDLLGKVYYKLGDYEKALKLLKKCEEMQGDRTPQDTYNYLGAAYNQLGYYDKGLKYLNRSFWKARQKEEPLILNNIGNSYLGMGNLAMALSYYEKAAASKPDLGEAHANLALVYKRLGHIQKAEEELKMAMDLGVNEFGDELKDLVEK